jgi:uncharacterized ion transporter superfamily protein YfcC
MTKRIPDAITIMAVIMVLFTLLTWVIPSGEYLTEIKEGRKYLIPGTYQVVENQPQGIKSMLTAPIRGFVSASLIIGFCLLVGGAFGVLNKTGAIEAGLFYVIHKTKNSAFSKKVVLTLLMVVFSVCGATFGMSESVLVFIMMTIPLARAMGYDSITGLSVSFLAAGVGFMGAITNPFTIGIAQGIAEIPLFSGWEYRLLLWFVFTTALIVFILRYVSKLERDPKISLVYESDQHYKNAEGSTEVIPFNTSRKIVLILLLVALVLIIIGSTKWHWYINEISAVFLALAIVSAVVTKVRTAESTKAFVNGAKEMIMAALVIGMAKGLLIIAEDGKIIGTMLHHVSLLLTDYHQLFAIEMMFLMQAFINFFVPSGSGQAALTMPIMVPLSDIIGISRQTAVLCFQLGDGIFNMIIPTSGVTMAALSIAGIPYQKWAKWLFPFIIILTLLTLLLLVPPALFFSYQ